MLMLEQNPASNESVGCIKQKAMGLGVRDKDGCLFVIVWEENKENQKHREKETAALKICR